MTVTELDCLVTAAADEEEGSGEEVEVVGVVSEG